MNKYRKAVPRRKTHEQWTTELSKLGAEGDWDASLVEWDDIYRDLITSYAAQHPDVNHANRAKDLKRIARYISKAPNRKTTPPWDVPSEVYRILPNHDSIIKTSAPGLGYEENCTDPAQLTSMFAHLLAANRN
jgi:hypothetical protein